MDDITLLRRAVDETTRIIDGVQPDQLGLPTSCPDFTVGQLIPHVAEGMEMFAAAADGTQPEAEPEWKAAADHVVTAFSRSGVLDGTIELPYGEFPAVVCLQQAIGDAFRRHDLESACLHGARQTRDEQLVVLDDQQRMVARAQAGGGIGHGIALPRTAKP